MDHCSVTISSVMQLRSQSKQQLFDQKAWLAEHANELKRKSVQQVFCYVMANHPNGGCALSYNLYDADIKKTLKKMKKMPTEDLAKYADAVAVACVDKLPVDTSMDLNAGGINETSIGNVAYISLYAKDDAHRLICSKFIAAWRAEK